MVSQFGNSLLLIIILMQIWLIFFAKNKNSRKLFYGKSSIIILSFLTLIYGFVTSDFSIQNIFFNSSTIKPLIYKISGSWASHEGSILLWLTLMTIINCIFIGMLEIRFLSDAIRITALIESLFSLFIYFTSNPFATLTFKPIEGLGLNPLLQDIALNFHPPLLYLGFVSYIVPFTCAVIILLDLKYQNSRGGGFLRKDEDGIINSQSHPELVSGSKANRYNLIDNHNYYVFKEILKQVQDDFGGEQTLFLFYILKKFSSFGLFFLTLGVGSGSWWAYRELGWGGFWFFDPVENISLMPWLFAIALHHCLLITVKTGRLLNGTLSLSIITFLSCIFGTFLTRSGLLTSVHSFASSGNRAIYLLGLFIIITFPALYLLVKNITISRTKNYSNFREIGIKSGAICFILAGGLLFFTLIYPIIYQFLYDQNIAFDSKFFINMFVPIFIPITFLAAAFATKLIYKKQLYFLTIASVLSLISCYKLPHNLLSILLFIGSIYLIIQTINILLNKSNYFRKKISAGAAAMIASHAGFGLLIIAIILNTLLKQEFEFIGKLNDRLDIGEFNITLKNIRFAAGPNYYRQIAEFWVEHDNEITILKPENRFYQIEKAISMESDIYSYLTHDLYAVLSKIDDDVIYAQIYYNPFISIIWLSVVIIALGFAISILKRRN